MSSGTVAAVVFACRPEGAEGRLTPVVGEVPTVGNRPDGFVGETLVPPIGSVPPDVGDGVVVVVIGVGVGVGLGVGLGVVPATTSVAALVSVVAAFAGMADTVADSCHCCPTVAEVGTSTTASSSSA